MRLLTIVGLMLLAVVVSGCEKSQGTLTYTPPPQVASAPRGPAEIIAVAVTDRRKNDPNWLGAVRGGFGNPIKVLETPVPVRDVIRTAYEAGMAARGLNAPPGAGRYRLVVNVDRMDSSQYVRREAHAHFDIQLTDDKTARLVYQRRVVVDLVKDNSNPFDTGAFASAEDLRKVAAEALDQAVNDTLDDPNLRKVLASG